MEGEQPEIDSQNSNERFETQSICASTIPMRASEFIYCLDEPLRAETLRRWRRIAGWCVSEDARPPACLRLRVGDKQFDARCIYDRPDVATYLHRTVNDVRCGFSFIIETVTQSIPVSLSARNDSDEWTLIFSSSVRGSKIASPADHAEKESWELLDNSARYAWWFDRPDDWPASTDPLYICGWCVDRTGAPVRGIRARTERKIFPAQIGIQRRDLRGIFPDLPFAHCSGFAIEAALPSGAGTIDVEVLGPDECWHLFDRRSYFERRRRIPATLRADERDVFRAAGGSVVSRFAFWLEPRCNWSRMPKRQRLAGWCVALAGPPIAEIRALIGGKESLARCGLMRPEVKAAFPGVPGTVDSGFLVTAEPSLGSSELVLEARSREGEWEPFMRRGVHRPLFWGRHENAYGDTDDYSVWIKLYDRLTWRDRRSIGRHIRHLPTKPKFSILLPAYNTNPRFLRRAIASLHAQLYVNWELCAVDDASNDPEIWRLLQRAARRDRRIKIVRRTERGNISVASNDALQMASGTSIGFLDHDDELAPTALYYAALELNRTPAARILYTDEDKLDDNGKRFSPYFKSSWDPEFFLTQNYLAHFCIIAADLVRRAGGFRIGFEGAQDYDLLLRCLEQIGPEEVAHIPQIGYHWRSAEGSTAETTAAKPYAHGAALRAVQEHLDRRGIAAQAVEDCGIYQRVKYRLPAEPPRVSIIIPTRDRVELL
ncbi:MAG TPA: glycosyltransferase, partial [Chthoniobacterales bacterium]|nr:glycosyltransferase [Chthoniobacterales bacterium]